MIIFRIEKLWLLILINRPYHRFNFCFEFLSYTYKDIEPISKIRIKYYREKLRIWKDYKTMKCQKRWKGVEESKNEEKNKSTRFYGPRFKINWLKWRTYRTFSSFQQISTHCSMNLYNSSPNCSHWKAKNVLELYHRHRQIIPTCSQFLISSYIGTLKRILFWESPLFANFQPIWNNFDLIKSIS